MKLQLPETLLTQPVETPTGTVEALPLKEKQLDPILETAVESQPEVKTPEPAPAPAPEEKAKPAPTPTSTKKPLPLLMLGLAVVGALVAVASQGTYGSQPTTTTRASHPHAPPAARSGGIVWE